MVTKMKLFASKASDGIILKLTGAGSGINKRNKTLQIV